MAFPQVASITQTAFSSGSTTHNVNMPATVSSGDLLLLIFGARTNPAITTPSGYDLISSGQAAGPAAGCFSGVYARIADGTEGGGSLSVSISLSRQAAAQVYRITGAYATTAGVEAAFANVSPSSNPNPPNLAPSFGGEDILWLAVACAADDDEVATAAPTNYTDLTQIASGGGANLGVSVISARRQLNAASEDPGTFTLNEGGNNGCFTVAIRPAAAGGPASYSDSISLGLSAGVSLAGLAAANDSVPLGVTSGLSLLSVASAGDAVSIGLSAGLSCVGTAAAVDTLALGLAAGINNDSVAAALGAISVGIGLGISVSDAALQQYSDSIGLGVGIGITAASVAAAADGFTLTLEAGISTAGQAAAQATISIGITPDILLAAQASTFDAIQIGAALGTAIASSVGGVTPPARRIIAVPAQGRAIQVQIQTRRIVV
jgi:hypothetical protein